MPSIRVDLRSAKSAAAEGFPPGHPGREAILAQPDELDVTTLDGLFPTLVRLLRMRTEGP